MMFNKPFKPPMLKKPSQPPTSSSAHPIDDHPDAPAAKKRRLDQATPVGGSQIQPSATSTLSSSSSLKKSSEGSERYYNALWRKPTAKKHKTWDGDAIVIVKHGYARLQEVSGRDLGRTTCNGPLYAGSTLTVGGKDVEIESMLPREDYLAGRAFLGMSGNPKVREVEEKSRTNIKFNTKNDTIPVEAPKGSQNDASTTKHTRAEDESTSVSAIRPNVLSSQFKTPLLNSTSMPKVTSAATPRHDPTAPGALVMKRPKIVPAGKAIVDVVVDPHVCSLLRDHQREGVKFLYECVMGMRAGSGEGAVLADEMGLGKTLQVIALLWTLLKQSPYAEEERVIKKALIVCPVTLIKNWRKEFRKWLGNERLGVFIMDDNRKRITDFTRGKAYSVMIIGYEKLRQVQTDLQKGSGIDIVICDEGHRLKTAQNKSALAIKSLNTERRVILSGTPLQNDLSEFYFMVDFVNPGLLEKPGVFRRAFETPILKSRQPEATQEDIEKGEARSAELAELTSKFILRRTSEILAKYLPAKTESILFCRPTSSQASVYRTVISPKHFAEALNHAETALQLINILKKVCNSPSLLKEKVASLDPKPFYRSASGISTPSAEGDEPTTQQNIASILNDVPSHLLKHASASGKLRVLDALLHQIHTHTSDKVVIVSNYTSTLDLLEPLLSSLSYSYSRLDGKTSTNKRQELVDRFNRTDAKECFAFLLSAKSGGVGINLIGANRLILFDVDWNPATDLQAMARIHRDGQKKECHIYRLLTIGALDEKIYQRQLTKLSLADSVVDNKVSKTSFTKSELRNLFTLDESGSCQTHELLGCECGGSGELPDPATVEKTDVDGFVDIDDLKSNGDPSNVAKSKLVATVSLASEIDMDAQEEEIERARTEKAKGKMKMLELMKYRHFDVFSEQFKASMSQNEEILEDVLMKVLTDEENRVAYVFSKTMS